MKQYDRRRLRLTSACKKIGIGQIGFTNTVCKSKGRPAFAPSVFFNLYLYGYFNKIRSSRTLQKERVRNLSKENL